MAIWVYSPVRAVQNALRQYVAQLGFQVARDQAAATAALIDLSSYEIPLPAAPATPTLGLLASADTEMIEDARSAGYVVHLPTDGEDHLRQVLAQLVAGRGEPRDGAGGDSDEARPAVAPRLTPRETQVLNLLMLGLSNKHIAKSLRISERTVKFHLSALMRKHGVSNRTKLMLRNPIVVTRLSGGDAPRRP